MASRPLAATLLAAWAGLAAPTQVEAQAIGAAEREALVRRHVERGGRAEDIDRLLQRVEADAAPSLPLDPVRNKIREGLSKGVDVQRIDGVVREMMSHLAEADGLLRELSVPEGRPERTAVVLLAESLDAGVTADDVRVLRAAPADASAPMSQDRLASSAKGLAFIRAAQLPPRDGRDVMAEALRRGFRGNELVELGRDVKRRERDFQTGRASLRSLRDAIARGERPEQLLRDARETPASTRPESTRPAATRPDGERAAPARPEAVRPEPVRPERPATPERPSAPERPGR